MSDNHYSVLSVKGEELKGCQEGLPAQGWDLLSVSFTVGLSALPGETFSLGWSA